VRRGLSSQLAIAIGRLRAKIAVRWRIVFSLMWKMIVGVLKARLVLHGVTSLKQKRSIIKSLIGRLKSRFNTSVAEVDSQDVKTAAVIAVVAVANDTRFIDQQFDKIISFMRRDGRFYLGTVERETF